ncbi:MAG: hypothetical protein ACOX8M_01850 [Marvinbryantia sp.]|jgi:hypothetical protein
MPKIIPINKLKDTTEISKLCYSSNEPVFITKNGFGHMVMMSIETFEKLYNIDTSDIVKKRQ